MTNIESRVAWALSTVEPEGNGEAHAVWKSACHAVSTQFDAVRFEHERFIAACKFDYYKTNKRPKNS